MSRYVACACCGRRGRHEARGLRVSCYDRHRDAGRLDQWPRTTPAVRAEYRPYRSDALDRLTEYAWLRSTGVPQRDAADRVGITYRTATRYNRALEAAS